jgi:tRNA A37 threonylcarbamoyladenosine synthetase subunit TsaC/SUA5/YrdC
MMMSRQKHVGIRIPNAPIASALAAGLGRPLITSSASAADGSPLVDAKDIKAVLGHGLDLILDGGLQPSEPSTILSLVGDQIEVLRQGKGIVPGLDGEE